MKPMPMVQRNHRPSIRQESPPMSDSSIVHAHQFDDAEQQHEASWLGMWGFLATGGVFFGGMFLGYTIYRSPDPEAFADPGNHLALLLGTTHTAVMIWSSFAPERPVRSTPTAT